MAYSDTLVLNTLFYFYLLKILPILRWDKWRVVEKDRAPVELVAEYLLKVFVIVRVKIDSHRIGIQVSLQGDHRNS